MTILNWALCGFLGIWGILSVLYQVDKPWIRKLSAKDVFSMLPLWTFFAPHPGRTDYHLLYRDKNQDGTFSQWSEIGLCEQRKWYSWLWNPEKRSKKVLTDVVQILVGLAAEPDLDSRVLVLSTPYVLTLNIVMSCERPSSALHRQFVIAQTAGFVSKDNPKVVMRSNFHEFSALA